MRAPGQPHWLGRPPVIALKTLSSGSLTLYVQHYLCPVSYLASRYLPPPTRHNRLFLSRSLSPSLARSRARPSLSREPLGGSGGR